MALAEFLYPSFVSHMTFHKFQLLSFLSLVAVVSAGRMVLHEHHASPPTGFKSQGPAPGSEIITLRVGLTSNNITGLQDKLLSVSMPGGSEFRQWLSIEDVRTKFYLWYTSSRFPLLTRE
jgi:tripeptidyl-peptidase-1